MTRFNLHPNRVVQTRNPAEIACAVKVVVRHLKPQTLEVLDLWNPKAYYWRETKGFPPYLGYP